MRRDAPRGEARAAAGALQGPMGCFGPPLSRWNLEATAREAGRIPRPNAVRTILSFFVPNNGATMSSQPSATAPVHAQAQELIARNLIFLAGGEFLSAHFQNQEALRGCPEGGYGRRPLIGLRLAVDDRKSLTCKPGWTPAKWRYADDAHVLAQAGRLHIDRILIELVSPGIKLKMSITEDGVRLGGFSCRGDRHLLLDDIKCVGRTFHRLIADPMATFAAQSDRCCCCGKALTDITSRLRGIGPECVKYFAHVENAAKAVRRKFRSLDAEWWSA